MSPSPQAQALETVSHPEETIPPSVSNNVDFSYLQGSRIFLDLCSGAGHPLTSAMLQRNCICFPVDKLICDDMDILDNSFFEPLLRVCSSGCVGYAGAAPNCGEYSRLKLKPHGPPALRTPEFMQGLPGLTPAQLDRVQASYELMTRCVLCLELVCRWTCPPRTTDELYGVAGGGGSAIHKILCYIFGEFSCLCFLTELE